MAGSGDNIQLLLSCKVDEFNCISGYTDCEVCVLFFFRMFHCIDQFFFTKYINVEVMSTLVKVSVKYMNKVLCTFFFCMSQSIRVDGLSIGDTILDLYVVFIFVLYYIFAINTIIVLSIFNYLRKFDGRVLYPRS